MLLAMVVTFGMTAFADTTAQCTIAGASDGATATVSIEAYDPATGVVTVGFYNDSEKQVTIIATVKVGNRTRKVVATLSPNSSQSKQTNVGAWNSSVIPQVTISSAKCKK